jgi:hypothetical protein
MWSIKDDKVLFRNYALKLSILLSVFLYVCTRRKLYSIVGATTLFGILQGHLESQDVQIIYDSSKTNGTTVGTTVQYESTGRNLYMPNFSNIATRHWVQHSYFSCPK